MLRILLVVIGISLLYWLYSRRNQLFKRHTPLSLGRIPIEGIEIRAFLDLTTPLECLVDDGQRFGRSFQMKDAPVLPHNALCQCELVSLSYESPEVFHGDLEAHSFRNTILGQLNYQEAKLVKKMLIGLHAHPLPLQFETFCQQFNSHEISEMLGTPWRSLIKQRFDQIQQSSSPISVFQENLDHTVA